MRVLDVIKQFKNKGYKVTPQRRAIINALLLPDGPPTATEVLEKARVSHPGVSLDTVYRNLNLLVEMGCLIQINLKNNEKSRFEIVKSHHHHLVCLGCGESVCLEQCPLLERDLELAKEKGYKVMGHAFEIYGYCPACQKTV